MFQIKKEDLVIENDLKKSKTFDSINFLGKSRFEDDCTQSYLIFQPTAMYIKTVNVKDINYVLSWKSRGLSDEKIDSINTVNYILNPYLDVYNKTEIRIKLNEGCLKQFSPTILHGGIVNIYIVYEIANSFNANNYPTLENCLFGSVKLTKHVDIDQYEYSGYGIGFERKGRFSMSNETGRNLMIFGVDMSSSTKIDNRKNDILVIG